MEIERINNNTLRVVIDKAYLQRKGMTILDLLEKPGKTKSFFYGVLEDIDRIGEGNFINNHSKSEVLTFKVLPTKYGLELFISKKYPTASQLLPNNPRNLFKESTHKNTTNNLVRDPSLTNKQANYRKRSFVFEINDFEDFINLSHHLRIDSGRSDLFLYKNNYYLQLTFYLDEGLNTDHSISDDLSVANEFGTNISISLDELHEKGKLLMETSALELSRYYFS